MNTVQALALTALVAVWAWVLGRPLLQNMFNVARRDPVGHFNKQLSVLGQAPERSLAHNTSQSWGRQPARKRRLQMMMALVMAVAASGLLALFLQGIFVWQLGLLATMLVGYIALAARAGAYEAERSSKVAFIGATSKSDRPVRIQAVGDR